MNGFVITAAGQELLAATLAGETLTITRVSMGSGKVPDGQDPTNFTDLIAPVAEGTSTLPIVESSTVSLIVEYRNDLGGGLESGFSICEFGVFARTATRPEALLYYASLGEYPQWVGPLAAGLETRRFPIRVAVSNDADVTLAYPAGAFVTAEEFETQLSQKAAIYPAVEADETSLPSAYPQGISLTHFDNSRIAATVQGENQWRTFQLVAQEYGALYFRVNTSHTPAQWTDLLPLATATPPQEPPLPLVAGFDASATHKCCYSKAQNGFVLVHVAVHKTDDATPADWTQVAQMPAGFLPDKIVSVRYEDGYGSGGTLAVYNNGRVEVSFATTSTIIGTICYYAASGPIAYGAPVRMAAMRSARMAISEEPIDKCFCVVDADGAYRELVLVTITYDELGALYTPHYYSLKEGEQLVDTQHPATRPHAGADGYILPRWDFDALVWTETATAEEITAWEAEHPTPAVPGPSAQDDADSLLIDHEYRLTLLELGVIDDAV